MVPKLSRGEAVWKWAVRTLGLTGVVVLFVAFALGRDVPTALIVLTGGMIGLEPIVNWQQKANE